MTRNLRFSAVWVLCALFAVSSFAQDRTMVGTVVDLDEADNQIQLQLDDAAKTLVMIEADAVTTTYHGFGTVIADKPEVFVGSRGFSNLREGDRIEVRGPMRGQGYDAQRVTLLGREVAAGTTGVGQTRDPQRDISTPVGRSTGSATATAAGRLDGTIRQINERDGRIVVETTDRRMVSVTTRRNTPVYYRGERYTTANLEIGDRVRIESDARDTQADEIAATRIDVTVSVQDTGTVPGAGTGGTSTIGILEGRVTRVEPGLDYIYVDDGRGEIRVDMRNAEDARGEILRARDIRVGERVEITGSMNRVGDMYLASTVRVSAGSTGGLGGGDTGPIDDIASYGLVTITGTVTETLEDAGTIGFRNRDTNAVVRIWVSRDFVLRTNAGTHVAASTLRVNDTAVIQAFRDNSGNLIAQTIRLRNR
jgi:hypothetical protein